MSENHVRCYRELPNDKVARQDMLDAGWDGQGWYFWDETEAYCHGPFGTRDEAVNAEEKYAEVLG